MVLTVIDVMTERVITTDVNESARADFITKNPNQIKKNLISRPPEPQSVNIVWYDDHEEALNQTIMDIETRDPNAETLLLSRYSQKYYRELDANYQETPNISPITLHASKGKQADYVIIYGIRSGRLRSPSEIQNDPILNLILDEDTSYPYAEERRVFYVGLTRAKKAVCLLADRNRISEFISETIKDPTINIIGETPHLAECPKCGKGIVKPIKWRKELFYSCSNYPLCNYKPERCPECGSGYLLENNPEQYICINEACRKTFTKCEKCEGYLVKRNGNPDFYGCSNYHKTSCTFKKEIPEQSIFIQNKTTIGSN